MASGIVKWLAAALVCCLTAALLLLPPKAWVQNRPDIQTSEVRRRLDALSAEVTSRRQRLQHLRWVDSLSALALATQQDGWTLGMPPDVPSDARRGRLVESVRREVEAVPARRPDVVLGLFVQDPGFADYEADADIPRSPRFPSLRFFLTSREETPVCLGVRLFSKSELKTVGVDRPWVMSYVPWRHDVTSGDEHLGPCRVVARYGMPGGSIRTWIEDGGLTFLLLHAPLYTSANATGQERGTVLFGRNLGRSGGDLRLDACLAGRASSCRDVFAHPLPAEDVASDPQASYLGSVIRWGLHYELWWQLGSALEQEFGPEAFQRFWASDKEVLAAFRDAFGVDAGEWMAGWLRRNLGEAHPGPLPTRTASLTSLLFILTMAGVGVGLHHRRAAG